MGQPPLLMVMCLGSLLIVASMACRVAVLYGTERTPALDVVCNLIDWLWYLGVFTILTILICKLYRVHKVTRFRRNQKVLPQHVLGPFAVALIVGIAIMTTVQILAPKQYVVSSPETGSFPYCQYAGLNDKTVVEYYAENSMMWYILLLEFGLAVFAWKLRDVNEEIGNSRRIIALLIFEVMKNAIGTILVVCAIILGPELGYTEVDLIFFDFILRETLEFLHATDSIAFIICPIMYHVWYQRKHGHLPEGVGAVGVGRVHVNVRPTAAATAATAATVVSAITATSINDGSKVHKQEEAQC